MFPN